MNILIVSEAFSGGGLETHIYSYYKELKQEHNIYFAIGHFNSNLPIEKERVFCGFNFLWESTVGEFCEDVEAIVKLVREKNIDVIHVHPFFSLFPAVIASQITRVPIVATYHGIASFSFTKRINDTVLFFYSYTQLLGKIFCVSDTGRALLYKNMNIDHAVFIPNAVDFQQYKENTIAQNKCWALVSRLDQDNGKAAAIKKLFDCLDQLDIERLDVYGDGSETDNLKLYAEEKGISSKITWKGFQTNIYECLDGKYNGILGTDRVAIEGLVMGFPVLGLGYGRINGVYDDDMLTHAKHCNFDAGLLRSVDSVEALNEQLQHVYADSGRYNLRNKLEGEFDIAFVAREYVEKLKDVTFSDHANILVFYEKIQTMLDPATNLYNSGGVFAIMRETIEYYAVNPAMKLLFLQGAFEYEMRHAMSTQSTSVDIRHENVIKRVARKIYHKCKKVIRALLR